MTVAAAVIVLAHLAVIVLLALAARERRIRRRVDAELDALMERRVGL